MDIQLTKNTQKKISQLYKLIDKEDKNLGKKIFKRNISSYFKNFENSQKFLQV